MTEMKKMIVVHMNLASGFGGGEVQVSILANALKDKEITQYGYFKKSGEYIKKAPFEASNLLSFFQLIKLVKQNKDNVILHAHDGRSVHLAAILKSIFGVKFIITRKMAREIEKKSSQRSYQKADKVIAISHAVKESLMNIRDDVDVIFDSYPELKYDKDFEDGLKLPNKFVISQIANFLPVKNHKLTIELAKMCQEKSLNVHFLLAGKGSKEQEIKHQAEGLNNVSFVGFTPYIGTLLSRTNLLIMPSLSEGFGTAVLEANSLSVPVLAASVGGLKESVRDGVTGFLIEEDNASLYFSKLNHILENEQELLAMRKNIEEHISTYAPAIYATNYYQLYSQLLSSFPTK